MGIWGARVLVVDDDEPACEAVSRALRQKGADVVIAPDAGAALAALIGVMPDVIVVDLARHAEDGVDFVRKVRSLSPEKGGQVPALTLGVLQPGRLHLRDARGALFQGHLLGPFDAGALQAAVGSWAGQLVERRGRALGRHLWPGHISRDRRAELRSARPRALSPSDLILGT